MKSWFTFCVVVFRFGNLLADYTFPVTHFKQLTNGDRYGNLYINNYLLNNENVIQLSWDYVHFYHDYELYWWTAESANWKRKTIALKELTETRFEDVEYYSFEDVSPNVFVYYFQIRGWLYGRGYGEKSKILKTLKPNKGQPFPVSKLRQVYHNLTKSIYIKWKEIPLNETGTDNVTSYRIMYCLISENCFRFTETTVTGNQTEIENPQNVTDIFKVLVYGLTGRTLLDEIAKHQANHVIARPGFIGQPSELRSLFQVASRDDHAISFCWHLLNRSEIGDSSLIGYEMHLFLNGSFFKSWKCSGKGFVVIHKGLMICTVFGLSNRHTYDIDVFAYNSHGDGFKKRVRVSVNRNISIGLPSAVKELTQWDSGLSYNVITLRWLKLVGNETGLLPLQGYRVTWRIKGSSKGFYENVKPLFAGLPKRWHHRISRRLGRYQTYTIRNRVEAHNLYTISVCGYNYLGSGQEKLIENVKPGLNVEVKPKAPEMFYQLPNLHQDMISLSWKTVQAPEILPITKYRITITHRDCSSQLIDVVPGSDEMQNISIGISCSNIKYSPIYTVTASIQAVNSHTYSEKVSIKATTHYIGLSAPTDLTLLSCSRKVLLVWKDVPENYLGYCISHRSWKDKIWNSCCLKKFQSASEGDSPSLIKRGSIVTYNQNIRNNPTHSNDVCTLPTFGKLQFKVSAFNNFGTGYSKSTDFTKCVGPAETPKKASRANATIPTLIILAVVFTILVGLLIWRCKRRQGGSMPYEVQYINGEEMVTLMGGEMKLPTYEEALLDTPTGPPPSFEETFADARGHDLAL